MRAKHIVSAFTASMIVDSPVEPLGSIFSRRSSGRVSEVLNGKRQLGLTMIKRLHAGLHIPYESLLSDEPV